MAEPGAVIAVGGHEDKEGDKRVLSAVAERARGGRVVIATIASHSPAGYFEGYQRAFGALGLTDLSELYLPDAEAAYAPEAAAAFEGVSCVYFSGGDQRRLVDMIAGTPVEARVRTLHAGGGLIGGTSAGASALGEIMMARGTSAETHRLGDLELARGLGLLPRLIIDQHFAERGRIGRLLGAVAHHRRRLGIGLDEDTALIVEGGVGRVVGSGGVYVVDGSGARGSNLHRGEERAALSLRDVRLHLLSDGDEVDLSPAP